MSTLIDLVADSQRTVLFSTHITSDLERVADRVAFLQNGVVAYHDEIATLKETVKRLRISASRALPTGFTLEGALRCEVDGTEALVSVTGYTDALNHQLIAEWDARVEVEDLNLEEIFLEMYHA